MGTTQQPQNQYHHSPINNSKNIKVMFWNARSILKHKEELCVILKTIDIFICVESWLTDVKEFKMPGFVSFRRDRSHSAGGGILILIKNKLAFKELTNIKSSNQSVEICGIQITNTKPTINLIACYRAPGATLPQTQWDEIISTIDTDEHSILMGDFNSHHMLWNCSKNDSNGERLLHSIQEREVFLHNTDTSTHIDFYRNAKSNLDLIISSLKIADKISVNVLDETWGSDHYPIHISIDADKQIYRKRSLRLKTKRTDWDKLSESLTLSYDMFLAPEFSHLTASAKYDTFVMILTKAVKDCTPIQKNVNSHTHRNPVCWWDSDCDKVKRLRRAAYKKWEYTGSLNDLIAYKKLSAEAIQTFKRKKRENFREFARSLNSRTNPTFMWNSCRVLKNSWVKCNTSNVKTNLQFDEKNKTALDKICPPWACTNPQWIPNSQRNEFFDVQFDFAEFNIALSSRNKKSSSGLDGIDYEIIQKMPIKIKLILLDILNEIYQTGDFPSEWKKPIRSLH